MSPRSDQGSHWGEQEAQRRYNGKEIAERHRRLLFARGLSDTQALWIEQLPFFFLATAADTGTCDCSFRGREQNAAGVLQPLLVVEDPGTLVFPDFPGNRLYTSLGNLLANPHAGLLFIDFPSGSRLRVNGRAEIVEDRLRYQHHWSTALRYVRISIEQVFTNCARRIPSNPTVPVR